jgi:hypothetical protein
VEVFRSPWRPERHLESYACLITHRGDAAFTAIATAASIAVVGDWGSRLWGLDLPINSSPRVPGLRGQPSQRGIHPPNMIETAEASDETHTILFLAANPLEN